MWIIGNGARLPSCTFEGLQILWPVVHVDGLWGSSDHLLTQPWHQHVDGFAPKGCLFGISRTQNLITGCEPKEKRKKSCVKATLLIHVGYKEIIWEVEQAQRQDHSLPGFMPWGRNYWEKYTALLWVQWEEKVKSKICPEIERFSSWAQEKDSEASWKVHVSAFCTINTPLWALIFILLENVSILTLIGSNARKKKKKKHVGSDSTLEFCELLAKDINWMTVKLLYHRPGVSKSISEAWCSG